jgi:hypothetical protein
MENRMETMNETKVYSACGGKQQSAFDGKQRNANVRKPNRSSGSSLSRTPRVSLMKILKKPRRLFERHDEGQTN